MGRAGGGRLRNAREKLGLTMRDVETATVRIARQYEDEEYIIAPSRLSDIETKGVLPSIFRLYSFSVVYGIDIRDILNWYGIDVNNAGCDNSAAPHLRSHTVAASQSATAVKMPSQLEPLFDSQRLPSLERSVERWGLVPLSYLSHLADTKYTYGYIGEQDFTMYPLLPPGTFVQVDESRNKVAEGRWKSEHERPVYFVETRDGFTCCWCALNKDKIVLQSHPLSPVPPRMLRHPQEAEVLGQVVGVAMKLGEFNPSAALPDSRKTSVVG
jgi:transcriptional regulator with XRE-family HTH domain